MIKKIAVACGALTLLLACLGTYVLTTYIPVDAGGSGVTLGLLASSVLAAGLVGFVVSRLPDTPDTCRGIGLVVALGIGLPLASLIYPGQITYAQFGLTVFGAIPVPFLDLTVNRHGVPWFRVKTHEITLAEVQPLVDDRVEAVVIGIGWDRMAHVEPAVRELAGGNVEVLATPNAFARYNQLRREGRCVVLLAHSTC